MQKESSVGSKPTYIEGVGWRYETVHSQKRRHKKHRYNDVGTYLVTIVVEGRKPVFGHISGSIKVLPIVGDSPYILPSSASAVHNANGCPATVLSPLGVKVLTEEIPKIHAIYPMVEIWKPICIMPEHYRLIHIQDKPISRYWKPEKSRFEACMAGTLLILAPWAEDLQSESDYDRFHNLNTLAAAVCALDAETAMKVTEDTNGNRRK